MKHNKNISKTYSIIQIIIGIAGLIGIAIYFVSKYKGANSASELMNPIMYSFIPFIIFFILIKLGLKKLI